MLLLRKVTSNNYIVHLYVNDIEMMKPLAVHFLGLFHPSFDGSCLVIGLVVT